MRLYSLGHMADEFELAILKLYFSRYFLIPAIIVNDEDPGLANLGTNPSINLLERWKRLWQTKEMQGDIPNNFTQKSCCM